LHPIVGQQIEQLSTIGCTMQDPEQLAGDIGRNVRRFRQQRNLTLENLAERAAVAKGTVIAIEQARANPNIGTLCRLADALGVGVSALIEPEGGPRVRVKRADETPALWNGESGGKGLFLMGTDPPDVVELWDWTMEPGETFAGGPHPAGSYEILSVLTGELAVSVGDQEHRLAVGDTILFDADGEHTYANPGRKANRYVMTVLEPHPDPTIPVPDWMAPGEAPPPSRASGDP
jgi:transcriptional regulator with XRE-family HTH domain